MMPESIPLHSQKSQYLVVLVIREVSFDQTKQITLGDIVFLCQSTVLTMGVP